MDTHEREYEYDIITLTDSEGQDVDFVYIATIEHMGREFCILVDAEEIAGSDNEATILEIIEDEDGVQYCGIDDIDLLSAVFEAYKEEAEKEE